MFFILSIEILCILLTLRSTVMCETLFKCSLFLIIMASRKSRYLKKEEKRQKRIRMIMGFFIISIMVLSSVAFIFVFYAPNNTPSVSGQLKDAKLRDGVLYVPLNGEEIPFYSYPGQGIVIPEEALSLIGNAESIVFLFDPEDKINLPFIEQVRWDFANYVQKPQGAAVTVESDLYNYPVGECDQATSEQIIIKLINGTNNITVDGSCIVINGFQTDFLLSRDSILYSYFGVV